MVDSDEDDEVIAEYDLSACCMDDTLVCLFEYPLSIGIQRQFIRGARMDSLQLLVEIFSLSETNPDLYSQARCQQLSMQTGYDQTDIEPNNQRTFAACEAATSCMDPRDDHFNVVAAHFDGCWMVRPVRKVLRMRSKLGYLDALDEVQDATTNEKEGGEAELITRKRFTNEMAESESGISDFCQHRDGSSFLDVAYYANKESFKQQDIVIFKDWSQPPEDAGSHERDSDAIAAEINMVFTAQLIQWFLF
ncbi:hypothetical protein ACOME3_009408 [Neoechinorhynchus agilis]